LRKTATALAPPRRLRDPVSEAGDAGGLGAVHAAIENSMVFEPVTDDPASTMRARRCEHLDRTFEAVKNVGLAALADRECLIVVVAA
jgi:hypothetical protein